MKHFLLISFELVIKFYWFYRSLKSWENPFSSVCLLRTLTSLIKSSWPLSSSETGSVIYCKILFLSNSFPFEVFHNCLIVKYCFFVFCLFLLTLLLCDHTIHDLLLIFMDNLSHVPLYSLKFVLQITIFLFNVLVLLL